MALGTRLSGSLPVSVAAHLLVLGVLLVAPLLADIALPPPASSIPTYVRAVPVPPPPAPAPRRSTVRATEAEAHAVNRDAAPYEAPLAILPERVEPVRELPGFAGGIGTGDIPDVGVAVRDPVRVVEPPAPPRPATVRVAELPRPPRKVVDARPGYPDVARIARVQGTVVLEAIIDRTGLVDEVRVVRSVPLLDQAAIDAVRQWRYTPSTLRGQPVAVLMTITINFSLQ